MVEVVEPHKCIVDRGKLKERISLAQGIHIDKQHLSVLHHHILCVVVAVDHMVVYWNCFHQSMKFFPFCAVKIVLEEVDPTYHYSTLIWHILGSYLGGVDFLKEIHIELHILVQIFRLLGNKLREGLGIQKLKD